MKVYLLAAYPMKNLVCLPIVILFLGSLISCQPVRWKTIKSETYRQFPTVRQISTQQLANWLQDVQRKPPLLLDVRTQAEYDVSHLAGAVRVEPGSNPKMLRIARDQPIVAYCSVGYRSSAFGKSLLDAGFTNVANLDGSIFQWANENRPISKNGSSTDKVHPFNAVWGTLLNKSYRAEVKPIE